MAGRSADEGSTLILRMFVTPTGDVRIRLIALDPASDERVLGTVTSAAAAAALVRGWVEAAAEAVSPPDPALDR